MPDTLPTRLVAGAAKCGDALTCVYVWGAAAREFAHWVRFLRGENMLCRAINIFALEIVLSPFVVGVFAVFAAQYFHRLAAGLAILFNNLAVYSRSLSTRDGRSEPSESPT